MATFEEYKFFGEWIQDLSDRRRAASQTYLTVNTAIFTVLAFLFKDAGFHGWGLVLVSLPLFLAGVMACLIWHKLILEFKEIIGWHYEQLREMETILPDCSQTFTKQWKTFYEPGLSKGRYSLSRLEIWLPRSFLGLYGVYCLGLVAAALAGWM
jgi:hypothetical protein